MHGYSIRKVRAKPKSILPVFGALERIRTSDPQLRKLMLYPLSYERLRPKDTPKGFWPGLSQ